MQIQYITANYCNYIVEQDHWQIKWLVNLKMQLKFFNSAWPMFKGYEMMSIIWERQILLRQKGWSWKQSKIHCLRLGNCYVIRLHSIGRVLLSTIFYYMTVFKEKVKERCIHYEANIRILMIGIQSCTNAPKILHRSFESCPIADDKTRIQEWKSNDSSCDLVQEVRTGRELLGDFHGQTVYNKYFHCWQKNRMWAEMKRSLLRQLHVQLGKSYTEKSALVNSHSAKTTKTSGARDAPSSKIANPKVLSYRTRGANDEQKFGSTAGDRRWLARRMRRLSVEPDWSCGFSSVWTFVYKMVHFSFCLRSQSTKIHELL